MSDAVTTLEKLFDTLKDASNRTEIATNKLLDQQMELVTHIKTMPMADLRAALKEHASKSDKDINACSGSIELMSVDITNEIKKLANKVKQMILVVTVALAVVTAGYFILRYAAEKSNPPIVKWEQRLQQIEQDQHEDIDERLQEFMREIKKEMAKIKTNNGDKTEDESIHNRINN